jgi:sugar phosphate isomerase/epimerase
VTLAGTPTIAGSTLVFAVRPRERPVRDEGAHVWAAELGELRGAGFDAVDLVDGWLAPADLGASELADLTAALRDAGLRPASISLVRRSVIDPDDGEANLDYTLRSLETAAALGAPVVSIGFHRPLTAAQRASQFWHVAAPQDDRDDATWSLAIERVGRVAERADELDLDVALELHEGTLLDSATGALRIVASVGSERLGVNPDIGNLVRVPGPVAEPWEDTLRAVLPHTRLWHVKNYVRLARAPVFLSAPAELAAGTIDYRRALGMALDAGFDGTISVEHYEGDALETIARGRSYLEELLRVRSTGRTAVAS